MSMCNNEFVNICSDSISQTSEPIRSLKSPTVELVGEDLEVEEQEGTEEEGGQEPTNEDLDTIRKSKTTSDVWEHFKRKKVDGKFKAQCHHCGMLYLGDSNQGTTHLCNHLKICPQLKFKDIRDMQQQVLTKQQNKVDGTMSLNAYQVNQVKVRNNLAHMVILHEYPLSMVDHIGFREFVGSLQPLFKLVRTYVIHLLGTYVTILCNWLIF